MASIIGPLSVPCWQLKDGGAMRHWVFAVYIKGIVYIYIYAF